MNLKLVILSLLIFIKGSSLMAASFSVLGQVTNRGLPASNKTVYIKASGADTSFVTDTLGNYFVNIKPNVQNGGIRVFFLDCKNDTVEENKTFTNLTRSFYVRLRGCPPAGSVLFSGTVKNYSQASRFISVYFSKDNFKTYFDSTKTGLFGKFYKFYFTLGSGTLYTRIRDCENNWITDSVHYNASDTLNRSLNFCKNSAKIYHGAVLVNGRGINSKDAKILRYNFVPSKKKFEFVDTISINEHGSFYFPKDTTKEYLIKVLPAKSTNYGATYYPEGIKWNSRSSRSVGPFLNNPLKIYLKDYSMPIGNYKISGKVDVHRSFIRPGYAAVGIHLLNDKNKVVGFTYSDGAGEFNFANLDSGVYQVWIDQCGLPTESKIIVLNSAHPVEDNLLITANNNGVRFGSFIGHEELQFESSIKVYPNPFKNSIRISSTEYESVAIQDMLGKTVYENKNIENIIEIRTENWEEGVYVITVQNKGELYRRKLVKK